MDEKKDRNPYFRQYRETNRERLNEYYREYNNKNKLKRFKRLAKYYQRKADELENNITNEGDKHED